MAVELSVLPQFGGYDIIDKVPDRLICSVICSKVLRDPHLTACCGQHFCESCLEQYFRTQGREKCPHCRSEGGKFIHIKNKALKREIEDLKIHCINRKVGCRWEGELRSLKSHLESEKGCGYVEVNCTYKCTEHLKRKDLADHLTQHCPLRKYKCQYCGEEDTYQTITEKHYDVCPSYPLDCPNGCGTRGIKRAKMGQHRSICPLELVECSNGCKKQLLRKDKYGHLTQHCPLRKYKCQHCGEEDTYQTITEKHYDVCPNYPLDCPNGCGTRGIQRAKMGQHRSKCPLEPVECPFKDVGCLAVLARKELDSHMATNQRQHLLTLTRAFIGAMKELDTAQNELVTTRNELEAAKNELVTTENELDATKNELRTAKDALSRTKAELKAMKTTQEVITDVVIMHQNVPKELADLALASIKSQLESKSLQLVCNRQPLTFRMVNINQYKQNDEVWYSPPFYYDNGYKMKLAVYANGTGAGAGMYMSITLLLMKGEFDHQTDWPIESKCDISIEIVPEKSMKARYIRQQKEILEAYGRKESARETLRPISFSATICSQCAPDNCVAVFEGARELGSEEMFCDHKTVNDAVILNDSLFLRITAKRHNC